MECLQYPFDANYLLRKKRAIRRELLETAQPLTEKRIAILCGSTTHDIKDILELFLLDNGCQRQSEIVRKRRRNFVVLRRQGGVTKSSVSLLK